MPEVDLSTVPTGDLLTEVLNRHCGSLFVGVREQNQDNGIEERTIIWTGGMSTVIGLLTIAHRRLLSVSDSDTERMPPDYYQNPKSEESS